MTRRRKRKGWFFCTFRKTPSNCENARNPHPRARPVEALLSLRSMLFRPLCTVCRRIIAARYRERGGNRNEFFDSRKSLFSISTFQRGGRNQEQKLLKHARAITPFTSDFSFAPIWTCASMCHAESIQAAPRWHCSRRFRKRAPFAAYRRLHSPDRESKSFHSPAIPRPVARRQTQHQPRVAVRLGTRR